MLVKLTNSALDYSWGSLNLISDYFRIPATGKPMAEIWFGTHDGSPTKVNGQETSLHDILSAQAKNSRLPYLLKILAAEAPLSIQAHPNREQAEEGFRRENSLGIALSASNRNYKDEFPKPELIVALSEKFDALVGFAETRVIAEKFQELIDLGASAVVSSKLDYWRNELKEPDGLRRVFLATLTDPAVDESFISEIVDLADQSPALVELVSHLNFHHGFDRGILTALLLNQVSLRKGEAIFVPAGMPHAYLAGLGVEVMLASDNVLRGGLTPKHIDVPELSRVLNFEVTEVELTKTVPLATGLNRFDLPLAEFTFYSVSVGSNNLLADLNLPGDAIVLCVSGALMVTNSKGEMQVINPAEAAFISSDARSFSISGNGQGFIAMSSAH